MESFGWDEFRSNDVELVDDQLSVLLVSAHPVKLKEFKDRFPNSKACEKYLAQQRGWNVESGYAVKARCPKCSCLDAVKRNRTYIRKTKDFEEPESVKEARVSYRCNNLKCRKEFSVTSGTLFHGGRTNLWLWYLTFYCMVILDGKVPKTFLTKEYYQYLFDYDEYPNCAYSNEYKARAYKNIGERVGRISRKLRSLFNKGKLEKRRRYLKYIGIEKTFRPNYLKWYRGERDNLIGWRISWTPGPCNTDNEIAMEVARNYGRGETAVGDVQFLKKYNEDYKGKWVLCFVMKSKGKIRNIRWLLVNEMNRLEFTEPPRLNSGESQKEKKKEVDLSVIQKKRNFAGYQLIQIDKEQITIQRPFRLTKAFYKAFAEAVRKYGVDKLKETCDNNILNCPAEILYETALVMDANISMNTEATGSLIDDGGAMD